MDNLKLFSLLAILLVISCSHKSKQYHELENVDSLLSKNLVESAAKTLRLLKPASDEDSAYFYILKAEIDYRQKKVPNADDLDYSIKYYEQCNDYRGLATAYYYKCMISVRTSSLSEKDVLLLKNAEKYAKETSDNRLKDKICTGLRFINIEFMEYEEALKYAQKEYVYAQRLTTRDVAYALLSLSSVYRHLNNKDSSEYYIMQCKRLSNTVNDYDKAFVYNLLGECFLDDNKDAALTYFKTAIFYQQLPEVYKNISDVYYSKNDTVNWRLYCDSALVKAPNDLKIDILSEIADMYSEAGDLPNYKNTMARLLDVHNQRYAEAKDNYMLEIQTKYNFDKQQSDYEKLLLRFFIGLFVIIVIVALNLYISRQKRQILDAKNKNLQEKVHSLDELINDYKRQLDYLHKQTEELRSSSDNKESIIANNEALIATLETKLKAINAESDKTLHYGCTIYNKMCADKSIIDLKSHWTDCVFYFEVKFPDSSIVLAGYQGLTVSNMLFVLCDDYLRKDENQLGKIFDISLSTVRSRRTKLKEKLT